MTKVLKSKKVFLIFVIAFLAISGNTVFAWTESPSNPIYDPVVPAEKAYYPSITKMSDTDYRMWYQTNSTAGNTTIGYATSADGLSWTMVTNQVSGLILGNAGHPFVKLVDNKFKIWYWNAATPYGNTAMHHAESVDGITWVNDIAITGNLTTVASGLWNSGTYGAIDMIINNSPTNTGTNPFDYKYAMYYDATSGGYEQVALGFSSDGAAWTLYGTGPLVPKGGAGAWDSDYVGVGSTVIKGNFWTMWYSGGVSGSSEGIGCATSVDGLEWIKCPNNPTMSKSDGVAWRNSRTYTPKIIRDGNIYKMWFTGKDTAVGNYAIGYATRAISTSTDNLYIREVSAGTIGLPVGTTSLVLDENEILNASTSVSSANAGTITIAGNPVALSNFTSGDLSGIDLSTPKNIGGKSVLVGKAVKVSSGVSGTPIRFVNPNIPTVIVSVPDATVVLASSGWDGTVTTPRTGATSGDTVPLGYSIGTAVDIGSSAEVLLFDKPVQVALSGITGSVGYKPSGSTIWTLITSTCAGTYDAPTLSSASFPGECSITNGTDAKILTYHLNTFGSLVSGTAATLGGGGNSTPTIVTFMGIAFPGGKISIIDRQLNTEKNIGENTVANEDGSFSISFVGVLQALHSFGLLVKDNVGRASQSKFFFVDTISNDLVVKDLLLPPTAELVEKIVTRGSNATVIGSATPGYIIHLELDGILIQDMLASKDGTYKFEIPTATLEFGAHTLRTRQADPLREKQSDFSTSRTLTVSRLAVVQADLNSDSKIDIRDWSIFLSLWGSKSAAGRTRIDFNTDEKVDIADFSIFIKTIRKK